MFLGARILVADDDPELLASVSDVLEHAGAHVVRASNGAELVTYMGEQGPFSLVITDVSMPWMSGLQAMHSARYAGLATPIIVMTGLKHEWIPEQVKRLGHDVVLLHKPFDLAQLEASAEALVGRFFPGHVDTP